MTDAQPSREAAMFLQLILSLQQAAMMALGRLMNPVTGKLEKNLEQAKATIDTLGALESRTRGNLESDEQRVLTQVLGDLRMTFLNEQKKLEGE